MAKPASGESPTSPRRVATRIRRAKAIEMRLAGATSQQILDAGIGYRRTNEVGQDIQRALIELAAEPAAELRVLEVARLDQTLRRLDEARAVVMQVLGREHVTVSNGRVVHLGDVPLVDDGPILAAVDRLISIEAQHIKVQERRAKLLGLDAAVKVQVIDDDAIDQAIRDLNRQLAESDAAAAAQVDLAEGVAG